MSVTLTIELDSLAQTGVLIDALRREIEGVTNTLRYYEEQAAEPFSQKGLSPEVRSEARAAHKARQASAAVAGAAQAARLTLVQSVWERLAS